MVRKSMLLSGFVIVAAFTFFGWKLTARGAYESAKYTVITSETSFEIREYPDLMVATTDTQLRRSGGDGSFMRLFQYISGANDREEKIAMTTPVFMASEANDAQGQMGFVIPNAVAEQRIPEPSSKSVKIRKRAGGRFAVIRFSGRSNDELMAKSERKLRIWMRDQGLASGDDVEFASYDPPWTPGPLRRNEILIRLK